MSTNKLDEMTEREAKSLLNDICNLLKIGGAARTPDVVLENVKNSVNDNFCRYKKTVEFLEGKIFRFIKKPNGYIFVRPGHKPDAGGKTILEAVERAIIYEDSPGPDDHCDFCRAGYCTDPAGGKCPDYLELDDGNGGACEAAL